MRGKLLGLVLAASILPLVILAVLSFQSARTNLEEMIGRQLVASSRAALGELSADLSRDGVLLASWAELSVMQDACPHFMVIWM